MQTKENEYYVAALDFGMTKIEFTIRAQQLGKEINPENVFSLKLNNEKFKNELGLMCENPLKALEQILESFSKLPQKIRSNIKVIPITSHGATEIALDKEGVPVFGVYCYDNPCFEETSEEFYKNAGEQNSLYSETGSARLPLGINSIKQLYYLKNKYPEDWKKVAYIIPLSSYVGFLLTGKITIEPTHLRNHGYLQNIHTKEYSSAVKKIEIKDLFPNQIKSTEPICEITKTISEKYRLPKECKVISIGHDSSAVAFLAKTLGFDDVDSSGTWHVIMSHGKIDKLESWMQERGVLYNADVYGENLRTTHFRGGQMREKYLKNQNLPGDYSCNFSPQKLKKVLENNYFVLPAFMDGAGVYPCLQEKKMELNKELVKDKELFCTALDLSLALQTLLSTELARNPKISKNTSIIDVIKKKETDSILICGPFAKEGCFIRIFSLLNSGSTYRLPICIVHQVTSLAAHIIGVAAEEKIEAKKFPKSRINIALENLTPSKRMFEKEIIAYAEKWEEMVLQK
jgi:hypothetical protein